MKIAEAFVEIRTQRAKAERDAKDTANGMLRQINDVFKAGIFIKGLQETIGQASDLNETISKTKQVFGASSTDIERWSQSSAKALGLSQRAALDAASTFALFAEKAGLVGPELTSFSTELTQLASDLASFYNTSPEDAVLAIGAALRGESEPIRQYGVLLDDATLKQRALSLGIYDGTGTLSAQSRVLAAQAEILAQTTKAQGDFARTADGAANSQRTTAAEAEDAAAKLGQSLLPAYTRLVKTVGQAAEVFGDLPAPVQNGVIALAGLVALSGPIGKVVDGGKAFVKAMESGNAAMRALSGAATTAGIALGSVAGAFVALQVFDQIVGRTGDITNEMNAFVVAAGGAEATSDDIVNAFSELTKAAATSQSSLGQFTDLLESGLDAGEARADAMREAFDKVLALSPQLAGKLAGALGDVVSAAGNGSEGAKEFADGWGLTADVVESFRTKADNAAGAAEALGGGAASAGADVAGFGDETETAAEKAERLEAAIRGAASAVDDAISGQFAYKDAVKGVQDGFVDLVLAIDAAKKDPTAENLRKVDDASEDLKKAFQEQAIAAADLAEEQALLNGKQLTGTERTQAQIDELLKLRDTVNPGSELYLFLQGYIDELLRVPGTVDTSVEVDADDALRVWDDLLDKITRYNDIVPQRKSVIVGVSSPSALGIEGLQRAQGANASAADFGISGRLSAMDALLAEAAQAETEFNTGWQRDVEDRIRAADDEVRNAYEAGDLSREAYAEYLAGRRGDYAQYSNEQAAIDRQLADLAKQTADEAEAANQASLDAQEDALAEHLARIEQMYAQAKARREFADAADAVDEALKAQADAGAKAYLYSRDPKRSAEERAAADAEYADAQRKAADALEERARAGAIASGLQDGTEAFAQAVRAALQADATNAPVLADEIARILLGIPDFGDAGVPVGNPGGAPTGGPFSTGSPRHTESGPLIGTAVIYGTDRAYLEELAGRLDALRKETL